VCESAAIEGTLVVVPVCGAVVFAAPLVHSLIAEYRTLESALEDAKIRT